MCVSSCVLSVTADEPISFRRDVAPLLLEHCVACHNAKQAEGGYRVDTFDQLAKAGDSGDAPLTSTNETVGELLRRITTDDDSERMPSESPPLKESQIELISDWIADGAKFDGQDSTESLAFVIPVATHPPPPDRYAHAMEVTAAVLTPDGSQLVTGGYHELLVWDLAGNLLRRIENVGQRTFALAWHPDGKRIAVACGQPGRNGEVRLIDFTSGEVLAVMGRSTDVIWDVAFRPSGDQVAVASTDRSIRVFDLSTLDQMLSLASHADWVTAVAWSPDGTKLASASRDKSAKIFDAESGQLQVSYQGHGSAVRDVCFAPDGKQAFTVGGDQKLHRWHVADAKKIAEIPLGGEGFDLALGKEWLIVPCSNQRTVKVDLVTNKVSREYPGHSDWVLSATLSPDQSQLVTGASDGEIRVWNVADGTLTTHWSAIVR